MGLLMGAIAGAAGAVEETTKYALRTMMDEEKAKRIAEYGSRLKSDEDLTTRARNKGDASDERARVQTEAQGMADKRGGLLSQSATDAYNKLAETDPEGAKLGLEAVESAKAGGGYAQEPTTRDMLLAQGDIKSVALNDDKKEDNALNSRKLDEAARRQDAWTANEATKRENEAKRIEAMFAKIGAAGSGKDKVPSRVAEATQIMDKINEERVASGKPKITFEDALQMHYKSADPAKEAITYESDGSVRERKVTRPITEKSVVTKKPNGDRKPLGSFQK